MSDFDEIGDALSSTPDSDERTYGGIYGRRVEAVLKWHYRQTQALEQERDDAQQAINRALIHLHLCGQPKPGSPLDRAWNALAQSSSNPLWAETLASAKARTDAFPALIEAAKAEALEDAANLLDQWESAEAHMGDPACEGPHGASAAYSLFEEAIEMPADWLRDRAATYRRADR